MKSISAILVATCFASTAANLRAQEAQNEATYFAQTSVATWHFRPKPEHNNNLRLVYLERIDRDDWIWGAAHFHNSFHQPTWYLFGGKRWHTEFAGTRIYGKITAGFLHGYVGEYKDQVPFNRGGTSPAILPTAGIRVFRNLTVEATLFGLAGLSITAGYEFR